MMRLLVCASRLHKPPKKTPITEDEVCRVLEELMPQVMIVGDATGVDTWAYNWAWDEDRSKCILQGEFKVTRFVANWDGQGRAAGHHRNRRMIEEGCPTIVLAFPGGPGTLDMCSQADEFNIPIIRYKPRWK